MERGLAGLAMLPVVVVPGAGRVRVQPVHVDDVVACLLEILAADRFAGEVLEVGGPDVLSIEELLQAIRVARGGTPGRMLHPPLGLMRGPALVAERAGLAGFLPVTAGQLASFANDSTAAPSTLEAAQPARMIPLERMLGSAPAGTAARESAAVGSAAVESVIDENVYRGAAVDAVVEHECRVFTRHLLGLEADAFVLEAYRQAVARVPALTSASAFDDVLLAWARRGPGWTRIADAYAALFYRDSALRRRLVMALAILETRAPFHQRLDAADGVPGLALWTRVAARVLVAVASLAAGLLIFVPVRAAVAVLGRRP